MNTPKINYQKELEKIINQIRFSNKSPALLLHSCCAPCSSYVLEYLNNYFDITVLYYNPNIAPIDEYLHRKAEQIRLINTMQPLNPIKFLDCDYEGDRFEEIAKGKEHIPEGGQRCFDCYELRLRKTAELAKEGSYDYFTTTLSISPLKNAQKLNQIGEQLAKQYGILHLPSDFKKNNGYKRSVELSREYNLYRQNYCGCIYSKVSEDR